MSAPIIQPQDCCTTCTSTTSGGGGGGQGQQGPPGPAGPQGAQGPAGVNGVNAYTSLSAPFIMPNIFASFLVSVWDTTWIANGQEVYIENAGYFLVTGKPSSVLLNLIFQPAYAPYNAAPGNNIPQGSKVAVSGILGPTGPAGSATPSVISYTAAAGTPPVANPGLSAAIAINTTDGGQYQWYNNAWH